MLQREATTTDAVVQIHVESLQFIDALRDLLLPAARKRLPIIVGWQFVGGKARKLLAETRIPVGKIAEQLGFNSPAYFTRAFQHLTGKSPSAFRRAG